MHGSSSLFLYFRALWEARTFELIRHSFDGWSQVMRCVLCSNAMLLLVSFNSIQFEWNNCSLCFGLVELGVLNSVPRVCSIISCWGKRLSSLQQQQQELRFLCKVKLRISCHNIWGFWAEQTALASSIYYIAKICLEIQWWWHTPTI